MCIIWHFVVELWPTEKRRTVWMLGSYLLCIGPTTRLSPFMLKHKLLSMQCDVTVLLCKFVHSVGRICGNGWYAVYVQLCIWQWICCTRSVSVHTSGQWLPDRHFVALVSTLGKEGNCVFGSRMMTSKHRMCGHQSWKTDCCMIFLYILEPAYR